MKAYALTWDGAVPQNLLVATAANLEAAIAATGAIRSENRIAVASAQGLDLPGPRLAVLYNAIVDLAFPGADNDERHVSRFKDRPAGQRRVFALLEEHFKDAPEAAAPSTVESPAAETETNEDAMAARGKKTAKKKAAPAAKKEPKAKKPKGAKATVREDSSRGKLLKLAVENSGGISIKSIASRAGVSGEGSTSAENRAKLRLRKVAENVGATVLFDDEKVTFKLPAGSTLDKIFGR